MMYAIIDFKGHQYIVKQGDQLVVDKIDQEEGTDVTIDTVVAIFDAEGKDVALGNPYLPKASVSAKILRNQKGDKVHVLKFRRKTRYERNYGFRPHQSVLQIESLKS